MSLITGAITRLINGIRQKTSGLSFSGAYSYVVDLYQHFYTAASTISFSGSLSKLINLLTRTISGSSATFTGAVTGSLQAVQRFYARSASGLIAFAGRAWRRVPLSGWLSRSLNFYRTLSGSISFAGAVITDRGQSYVRTIVGALFAAGAKIYSHLSKSTKASAVSASGTARKLKEFLRSKAGSISFSGISRRTNFVLSRSYSGAVSFTGNVSKTIYLTYSSALSFAGAAVVSLLNHVYSATAAISNSGAVTRLLGILRTLPGTLTLSGIAAGVKGITGYYYWAAAEAVISLSGTLSRITESATGKTYDGTLYVYGRITIIDAIITRLTDAAIAPIATLTRKFSTTRTTETSNLDFSGIVYRLPSVTGELLNNFLTATGSLAYQIATTRFYTAGGTISFSGSLNRIAEFLKSSTATITKSGAVSRLISALRTKSGSISFSGLTSGLYTSGDWRIGYLNLTGALSRYLSNNKATETSDLAFAGIVIPQKIIALNTAGNLGFAKSFIKTRETLYLGPPNYGV